MNRDCLDIGTIQAFLDGELTPEVSMSVSGHIAGCDACSMALGEAEEESAFVFPVLEREMNTLVPTQRLWVRINDSITVEKENTPFWKKVLTGIAGRLRNPSFAFATSFLIVFGIFAAVYSSFVNRSAENPGQLVGRTETKIDPAVTSPAVASMVEGPDKVTPAPRIRNDLGYQKATFTKPVDPKSQPSGNGVPPVNSSGYLPGEESYVKTIATLSQTVSGQKDSVMRPSQQVAYERDLAVVDDSIKRMRKEVRRDPKNESAKQVLYTSYQNKIDLLNSVAQKEELVASLK